MDLLSTGTVHFDLVSNEQPLRFIAIVQEVLTILSYGNLLHYTARFGTAREKRLINVHFAIIISMRNDTQEM